MKELEFDKENHCWVLNLSDEELKDFKIHTFPYPLKWNERIGKYSLNAPSISRLKGMKYEFNKTDIIDEMAKDIMSKDKRYPTIEQARIIAEVYFQMGVEKGICVHDKMDRWFKGLPDSICNHVNKARKVKNKETGKWEYPHIKSHEESFEWLKKYWKMFFENLHIADHDLEVFTEYPFYTSILFGIIDLQIRDHTAKIIYNFDWKITAFINLNEEEMQLFGYKMGTLLQPEIRNKHYQVRSFIINGNGKVHKEYELAQAQETKRLYKIINESYRKWFKQQFILEW